MKDILIRPISENIIYFCFMYLLGVLCIYTTTEQSYLPFFIKLFPELFLDIYIFCFIIEFIFYRWKKYIYVFFALIFYLIAIVDLFCSAKLGSTISPCILQLVLETNTTEATEFFNSYIGKDIIYSPVGVVIILMTSHFLIQQALPSTRIKLKYKHPTLINISFLSLLLICIFASSKNKYSILKTWHYKTIGEVENYLASDYYAIRAQYIPIYRLAFAIHANRLTKNQIQVLIKTLKETEVDSCSFRSPNIVLIIGESYNKHHSQLYGYTMPTTPYQLKRFKDGELFVFNDAVTPYNLTSDALKNAFSLNDLSKKEQWCDKPLFTTLFKKAGYQVTLLSNEFVTKQQGGVADFSGGMFLNNQISSSLQFDIRNTHIHKFDEGLITDYQSLCKQPKDSSLVIFSLIGQHIDYKDRYPTNFSVIKTKDYKRDDLTNDQLRIVKDYDNATRYNDYIVDQIIKLFEQKDAIVIYMPDHGDECFDQIKTCGRLHITPVTKDIAYNEYQIPFWIWCSDLYKENHQEVINLIKQSLDHRFISDDLPHMLLYLAGISCKDYREELNTLSRHFNKKEVLLRGSTNYDRLFNNY